jgi:hypothetical protein
VSRWRGALLAALLLLSAGGDVAAPPAAAGAGSPGAAPVPAAAADLLRRFAGAWDATMQVIGPPGEPPQVLNGIEVNASGGDGLWVTGDFRSQIDGRPFQGHSILTWDAPAAKFRRLWADSTSTAFWISEGDWDPKSATLTMWIETRNSRGEPVRWREETIFQGEGRTFTMFIPGPTTVEAAAMTITYKRRPAAQKVPPPGGPVPAPAGPELARLQSSAGVWSVRRDDRVRGEEMKGTETNTWCCDGRFLLSDVAGRSGKRTYAAHGIVAWDPEHRRYERAFVDTAGTGLERVPGAWDEATGTLTFHLDRPDGRGGTLHADEVLAWNGDERTATLSEASAGGGKVLATSRYRKER